VNAFSLAADQKKMYSGMSHISGELKDSAKLFKDKARDLNLQALYRKYGPPAIVILVLLFVIYIRYYLF
jgi:vesicle transport protein SEC22